MCLIPTVHADGMLVAHFRTYHWLIESDMQGLMTPTQKFELLRFVNARKVDVAPIAGAHGPVGTWQQLAATVKSMPAETWRRSRAACFTIWTAVAATSVSAQTPWADLARRDLQAVRQTILEHHPAPVDSLNPGYRVWLDAGYAASLRMADSVRSLDGVLAVLSFYTSGFQDGHLGWGSDFVRRTVSWPGIVLARRNDLYVVSHVARWVKNPPRVGDEMLSCDGTPMERRMNSEVMPFEGGIPSLEASRARLAASLLVWDRNPWRTRPASCRVREPGGERDVAMSWQSIRVEDLESLQRSATFGDAPSQFGISFPDSDVAWVTVPSLAENEGENRAGLEGLIKRLPTVRGSRLIVFDVRGNHGGNSAWGRNLAAGLFGAGYADAVSAWLGSRLYVQWRASLANADFIEQRTLPRFEKGSPSYVELAKAVAAIREAHARGQDLTPPPSSMHPHLGPVPSNPLAARVVLLTDGWCASACLDFADLLLAMPGVRHAGAPTYADAIYIDNRAVRLPSELGVFGFSMKVYRGRPRGHNQPYVPAFVYPGATWDTPSVQSWLLGVMR